MTREYIELGATTETRKKYVVLLQNYSDPVISQDTVETGVTGKVLVHRGTQIQRWTGLFRVEDVPSAGYGTTTELKALHALQTDLSFLPHNGAAATVKWLGPWQAEYIRGPLDIAHVPFQLVEIV